MHPLDKGGKTPLNLEHGVFSVEPGRNLGPATLSAAAGQKWETLKSPPRDALSSGLAATTAPARTSRTILEGLSGARLVSLSRDSSIVYDPLEHRFVNTNAAPSSPREAEALSGKNAAGGLRNDHLVEAPRNNPPAGTTARVPVAPTSARAAAPPSRNIVPPPAPHTSSGGGGYRGGSESATTGGGSSRGSAAPSAPAPHASAPAGGGGGRPH